tara:strand:+ start:603 stop:1640 length:1038 start_codon:yes stop_codon:yes gene_type:complete
MTTAVTAALVAVGGTLLAGKIQSNRAKDPKAAIGSGTSPSLSPGEGGQYTPVAGSELQDFGDFQYENMTEPEGGDEEQLLAMLQQMGMDGGVVNAAYGGELEYKAGGGGIGDLLQPEQLDKLLAAIGGAGERPNMDVIDFTSIEEPDLADVMVDQKNMLELKQDPSNLVQDFSMSFETETPGVMTDEMTLEEVPTGMLENAKIGIENYAVDNPEMFSAGLGALSDVVMAALRDMPERKGSNVRTQTLPGNASRRRSQLQNISPIGGSSVTFAKNGSALQRPMFMPQGGAMNGPGGPKDDLIPVMASNGEYMLSKAAVDAAGNGSHAMGIANLNKFNDMGNKRYGN